MTGRNAKDEDALETLFDAAARNAPLPDSGFLARLKADADTNVPKVDVRAKPRASGSKRLVTQLRGYFAVSGLTGAAVLGVWIGFVMPDILATMSAQSDTDEPLTLSTFLPGADLSLLTE